MIHVDGARFYLQSGLEAEDGRLQRHLLKLSQVHWNTIFLLFLLGMTPRRRLLGRPWRALAAAVALYGLHIGFFCLAVIAQLGSLFYQAGVPFLPLEVVKACAFISRVYSTFFAAPIPFLIYLPVLLGTVPPATAGLRVEAAALAVKRRENPRGARVRPNDPCPCGSGKKWKHCCGA